MNPAQLEALKWAATGFARTSRRSEFQIDNGLTMNTVAGLVRSGHIVEINGIFRLTAKGVEAIGMKVANRRDAK